MAVYAVTGRLFKDPTDARTGGTYIKGVADDIPDAFTWMTPSNIYLTRTGLGTREAFEAAHGEQIPPLLLVPMTDNGAVARQILYPHLTTAGAEFDPYEAAQHSAVTPFAMIVRPTLEDELHLYSPWWTLAEGQQQAAVYSQVLEMFAGNFIGLIPNRPGGETGPPWLWGSKEAIDAEYFAEEE